jgi:prevent-host-death family protein
MDTDMTNPMTMLKVNVAEFKSSLSRYLDAVSRGETVLICSRNVPVAELKGIARVPATPRPIGLGRGTFEVTKAFFEELPDEVLSDFSSPS